MKSVPTPNFVLTSDYVLHMGVHDSLTLPSGSFVRPIEYTYIPKHVLEDFRWKGFNRDTEVFCYTSIGMVAIPKISVRKL